MDTKERIIGDNAVSVSQIAAPLGMTKSTLC